jgi:UDP-N-acetylmuramoyl-tripeptide--D-alanyl-D-alanine ligase
MALTVSDPVAVPELVGDAPSFTALEVAAASGGVLVRAGTRAIRGAAVDSRRVRPGELFVAFPGDRTDGHRYLAEAAAAGAAGMIVTVEPDAALLAELGDVTVVQVPDAMAALQALATTWRSRFELPVVAVTGSVAKSSTKEAIATLLAADRTVLRSEGNENNEIGLPLTVLRLAPEHDVAVLEMGMYVGGEIAQLCRIARPSIGVVTAVRPIHLARAGSIEAIEAGKRELVDALPSDGLAVLNADDPRVAAMARRTTVRSVTYGFSPLADVRAEAITSRGFEGMAFELVVAAGRRQVRLPRLGRHAVHNALAAAAVAIEAGQGLEVIASGLGRPWSLPHRSNVLRLDGIVVVDDSYNAGPDSMAAALETLADLPGRHVAVLGAMAELGVLADDAHVTVGRHAAAVLDLLVAVGEAGGALAAAALEAGLAPDSLVRVGDAEEALAVLPGLLRRGDVVLVKASRAAGLERVAEGLAEAHR